MGEAMPTHAPNPLFPVRPGLAGRQGFCFSCSSFALPKRVEKVKSKISEKPMHKSLSETG